MLRVLFPLIIFIGVVCLLLPALAPGQTLLPGQYLAFMYPWKSLMEQTSHQWNPLMWDAVAQFFPWRDLYHQALHSGQLPLWNPYQFCGTPLYANAQSAIFYPPNLIFYIADPARAFAYSAVLHLFLAGLFTYMLARSLKFSMAGSTVSGLVYSLCAFNVTWLELPTLVNVATWLPLILLLSRNAIRKGSVYTALGAGVATALALLAGHLQIAFYVALASVAWCLWLAVDLHRTGTRRLKGSVGLLGIILLVGLAVAAVQLIPSMELGRLSHRAGSPSVEGYKGYVGYSLPAMNLVTAFVPDFFGNPSKGTFWGKGNYAEYAMYVGILPLVLAAAAFVFYRRKETFFFGALAALALLFAIGSPLNAIFYFTIPGFSATGSPGRILVLYCFSISMLAGMGASAFTTRWRDVGPKRRAKRLISTLAIIASVSVIFLAAALYSRSAVEALAQTIGGQASIGLYGVFISAGLIFVAGAILMWRAVNMVGPSVAAALILFMTIADLLLFGMYYNITSDRNIIYPSTQGVDVLQNISRHERIMPINWQWSLSDIPPAILPPNSSTAYSLRDVQGYDSLFPGSYKRFADTLQGQDSSPIENGNMVFFKRYNRESAHIARYVVSRESIPSPELSLIYEGEFRIYENLQAASRAEVIQRKPNADEPAIRWTEDSLNRVGLVIRSGVPADLTLRDALYPGWRAYVDGVQVEIEPTEGIFRTVSLPGGSSTVEFVFEPTSLKIGMYVSLMAVTVCVAFLVVGCATRGAAAQ